jgi:hypothetical protein
MRVITITLDERLQTHDRAIRLLEERVDRLHQAAIESERTL